MGTGSLCGHPGRRGLLAGATVIVAMMIFALGVPAGGSAATFANSTGELDCNGNSPVQQSLRLAMNCTDIRGFAGINNNNTWDGRFYDNGVYIGHDEPDMTFLSDKPGSGNNVTWTETLPKDPSAAPTATNPGSDVAHWFELSPAPWFSMAMCDPNSYPLHPCTPQSDSNAPNCSPGIGNGCDHANPGGGSAFMEMQFYPPGNAPWVDSASCDNTHWCAALTIDSLECTLGFNTCNTACEEPINFAFIQRNGVPAGPPSPQLVNLHSSTQNSETLLMNPGDKLTVSMSDAPVPGAPPGTNAFKVIVTDLTTGQTGYMQASAANGFQNTSISDCSGKPFNFQPEYNTAKQANIIPWAALQTNISTQFETGHFVPCTSVSDPITITFSGIPDTTWTQCHGPYESAGPPDSASGEPTDAFCYPVGDTHGDLHSTPDSITGCQDNLTQNGDLDFDGTPYWPEWPTGATPTPKLPGSFVQQLPNSAGSQYSQFFLQTDVALSESSCSATTLDGCTVPPPGPGKFYPYWSRVTSASGCTLEFGNVSSGSGVNTFGKDAQYGTNQAATLGYPEFIGSLQNNSCPT